MLTPEIPANQRPTELMEDILENLMARDPVVSGAQVWFSIHFSTIPSQPIKNISIFRAQGRSLGMAGFYVDGCQKEIRTKCCI